MELGSLFLILALALLVALYVAGPFITRKRASKEEYVNVQSRGHQVSALMAERDQILSALQELDFDNALGKIPAEDYPTQRGDLMRRGAAVLRELDTLQAGGLVEDRAGVEARLEAAVAARRADGAQGRRVTTGPVGKDDDDLEALIASRRRQQQEKSAGFCPQCGRPVQKSDKFCSKCGTTL